MPKFIRGPFEIGCLDADKIVFVSGVEFEPGKEAPWDKPSIFREYDYFIVSVVFDGDINKVFRKRIDYGQDMEKDWLKETKEAIRAEAVRRARLQDLRRGESERMLEDFIVRLQKE